MDFPGEIEWLLSDSIPMSILLFLINVFDIENSIDLVNSFEYVKMSLFVKWEDFVNMSVLVNKSDCVKSFVDLNGFVATKILDYIKMMKTLYYE